MITRRAGALTLLVLTAGMFTGCGAKVLKAVGSLPTDTKAAVYSGHGNDLIVLRSNRIWLFSDRKLTAVETASGLPLLIEWNAKIGLVLPADRSKLLVREGKPPTGPGLGHEGSVYLTGLGVYSGKTQRLFQIANGTLKVLPNDDLSLVAVTRSLGASGSIRDGYQLTVSTVPGGLSRTVAIAPRSILLAIAWDHGRLIWAVSERGAFSIQEFDPKTGVSRELCRIDDPLAAWRVVYMGNKQVLCGDNSGGVANVDLESGISRPVAKLREGLYASRIDLSHDGRFAVLDCRDPNKESYSSQAILNVASGCITYLGETSDVQRAGLWFQDWHPKEDRALFSDRSDTGVTLREWRPPTR